MLEDVVGAHAEFALLDRLEEAAHGQVRELAGRCGVRLFGLGVRQPLLLSLKDLRDACSREANASRDRGHAQALTDELCDLCPAVEIRSGAWWPARAQMGIPGHCSRPSGAADHGAGS